MSVSWCRSREPSGCGARAILASRRSDRSSAPSSDRGARPTIALTSGDTISTTVTIPVTVTIPGSSTATSSATTSASAAFGQGRACRQSSDCENEHEQSETCHVAPPP
jgi:hypothetical protein